MRPQDNEPMVRSTLDTDPRLEPEFGRVWQALSNAIRQHSDLAVIEEAIDCLSELDRLEHEGHAGDLSVAIACARARRLVEENGLLGARRDRLVHGLAIAGGGMSRSPRR